MHAQRLIAIQKRYGVDNSPPGACKATWQNSQIPQAQAPQRTFADASEYDGLVRSIWKGCSIFSIIS